MDGLAPEGVLVKNLHNTYSLSFFLVFEGVVEDGFSPGIVVVFDNGLEVLVDDVFHGLVFGDGGVDSCFFQDPFYLGIVNAVYELKWDLFLDVLVVSLVTFPSSLHFPFQIFSTRC